MTVLAVALRDLASVIVAATVAGVGVTMVFTLGLLAAIRGSEARAGNRPTLHWRLLQLLTTLGIIAAVVAGLYTVANA